MPPTPTAGDYFALLEAIEDAATELGVKVQLEGYPPPYDPQIHVIKVTPDPGVIEVNIHPAKNWREQVDITKVLYEEAAASRLSTEKFLLDGRHTGTGGGNHIARWRGLPRPTVLSCAAPIFWPAWSPIGRTIRPCPSSSRGFSSVPPARRRAWTKPVMTRSMNWKSPLANFRFFRGDGRAAANIPPWVVDRIFRNLLADVTGNTHRTEICIDKLYSPDGPTGRLGLVEFRGFEMPPHAEMSLAQQLLMRALIARFWREPYRQNLVRWGTALHDKFMLPHFVWSDFEDVVADMNDHGFAFDAAWFKPHFEFRFPLLGQVHMKASGLSCAPHWSPGM